MSAGMAEVIAAHEYEFLPLVCKCGVACGADEDELTYASHVAEELAKAGYGKLPGERQDKAIAAVESVLEMASNPGDVVGWHGAPDDLANFAYSIQSAIREAIA